MLNSAKQCKMICRHCCILLNKNATPLRSINSPSFLKFLSSINAHNAVQKNSVFFKSIVAVPLARYSSRNKQKKTSGDQNVDEDNDESGDSDDENEEEIKGKGVEVKTYSLSSLRIDLLLKTSLGYNRR